VRSQCVSEVTVCHRCNEERNFNFAAATFASALN